MEDINSKNFSCSPFAVTPDMIEKREKAAIAAGEAFKTLLRDLGEAQAIACLTAAESLAKLGEVLDEILDEISDIPSDTDILAIKKKQSDQYWKYLRTHQTRKKYRR